MTKHHYITTAIDYPNAAPHMGHVLEKVLADVIARWMRLRGDSVRFQIGTDEHGIKIQQTAAKEKVTPRELVDRNVPLFQSLYARLGISSDIFIRTTDQTNHWPTVRELWKRLQAAGVLEKRTYTGLYCSGCERFVTKKDLVDGKCPDHQRAPDEVKEENYFFKLKNEAEWLKNLLKTDYRIVPSSRENETFSLLDQGLEDISFSRPRSSLSWGIPVPGDEEQTMYVWCDALTNYVSGIGLLTDREHMEFWGKKKGDAVVTHVIGKDIARFHALIWPAMLKHAGIRPPDQLLIHGFLTSEGQKMSKSIGNVVKPEEVLEHFKGNPDPLRFYLSHEVPVGNDGDFSWKRIDELYDAVLRNKLGNLLNRVLVLLQKFDGRIAIEQDSTDAKYVTEDWLLYSEAMDTYRPHLALDMQVLGLLAYGNSYMDNSKPWSVDRTKALSFLSHLAEKLRHVSLMLLPFMPSTAQKMSQQLGVPYADEMLEKDFKITKVMKEWGGAKEWTTVGTPSILFPPLE